MENKYHKLSYSKYFELAVEGIFLVADTNKEEFGSQDLTEAVRDEAIAMFVCGYILGKDYTRESLESLKEGLNSMSDILIKQYFEEALANG